MAESIKYRAMAQLTPPDDAGHTYLLLILQLDCPACGTIEMQLPGHHLRAIRDLLTQFIDEFPNQTGKDDEKRVLEMQRAILDALNTDHERKH